MGLVCGLLQAVGPDHLVTLITLSTLMQPWPATKVGAAWGLGHSCGVVGIAGIVLGLGQILPHSVTFQWEYYGDYVIGGSMIAVGLYFLLQESSYLEMEADGKIVVKRCACHGRTMVKKSKKGFCSDYMAPAPVCSEADQEQADEQSPLIPQEAEAAEPGDRSVQGAVVGFIQGMCCPMGLVMLSCLPGQSPVEAILFVFTAIVSSILGTAAIACVWAYLTTSELASNVNPRVVYRGSCLLALALGIVWMVLNYYHVLDKFNYAEQGHESDIRLSSTNLNLTHAHM